MPGLADQILDLGADAVVGTSAGAFVGAALASGADLEELFALQQRPSADERAVRPSKAVLAAWARC